MSERDDAIRLANIVLERPFADPDDDLAMLSRQFLRSVEVSERLRAVVAAADAWLAAYDANLGCALRLEKDVCDRLQDEYKSARDAYRAARGKLEAP